MSIDGEMTLITALIRPHMEGYVVRALHDLPDFPGFTFTQVRGQGRGHGAGGHYVSSETDLTTPVHSFARIREIGRHPEQRDD